MKFYRIRPIYMSDHSSDQIINYMYDDDLYKDDDGIMRISRATFYILFIYLPALCIIIIILRCSFCITWQVQDDTGIWSDIEASTMIMDQSTVYVPELCTICIDRYHPDDIISTLKCGHSFHTECIKEWHTTTKPLPTNCPCCHEVFILS